MVAELQLIYQGCHVTILKYKYDFIQLFDNLSISFEASTFRYFQFLLIHNFQVNLKPLHFVLYLYKRKNIINISCKK